jgi:DNA-binding NarL/FixJ family response regulator
VRLVIADDVALMRDGLVRLLSDRGFRIVAAVGDAPALHRSVERLAPDAAIVDIRMPPTHTDEGLVAAQEIRERHPTVGVLLLSHHLAARYATRLLGEYPERVGYLLKDRVADVAVLADALHRIGDGECVIDPTIVSRLLKRPREGDPLGELTDRERDVLGLMAQGRSNAGIAAELFLSARTIETHVRSIFLKLDVQESVEGNRRVLAVLRYLRDA